MRSQTSEIVRRKSCRDEKKRTVEALKLEREREREREWEGERAGKART
jgi:hypothetical protein